MKKKTECGICGADALLVAEEREVRVGGRSAVVLDEFYRCSGCGEELYEPGQMDAVMRRASARIRESLGLLQPDEVRKIRTSLGLSQADFEVLLGVGKKTVVRWEKGTVFQARATDTLLRALRDVDGLAAFLSARSGIPIAEQYRSGVAAELTHYDFSDEDLVESDQFLPPTNGRDYTVSSVRTGIFAEAA